MLVTDVIQALVPKQAFGGSIQLVNKELGSIILPVEVGSKFLEEGLSRSSRLWRCRISPRGGGGRKDEWGRIEQATRDNTVQTDIF